MDKEKEQKPVTREEQIRLNIEVSLPVELRDLIMEVKLGVDGKGKEEIIVSACSWHNSKQNLGMLQESLPDGILISHGMCEPCLIKLETS